MATAAERHFERLAGERRGSRVCLWLQTLTLGANEANNANWVMTSLCALVQYRGDVIELKSAHVCVCVCADVRTATCVRAACETIVIRAANANELAFEENRPARAPLLPTH